MIVKSISWKTPGFQHILAYVTHHLKMIGTPVVRNLPVRDPADIHAVEQAFLANARYLPPRKNGVPLYHDILSFSPADRGRLTLETLTDLAGRYLELRATDALGYGTVHLDRGHPHIHVVISGNLIRQEKKLHLSRPQFADVKRRIEAYQKERYPQLSHSLVQLSADEERDRKQQQRRKARGVPAPEILPIREELDRAFLTSFAPDEFLRTLQAAGFTLLHHNDHLTGLRIAGTVYTFPDLGYPTDVLAKAETGWKMVARRMRTIESDETEKTRHLLRRFGYADELMTVLDRTGHDLLPAIVRERLTTIERDAEQKRRTYRLTHTGLGRRKERSED